jgi:hypothetical protein
MLPPPARQWIYIAEPKDDAEGTDGDSTARTEAGTSF